MRQLDFRLLGPLEVVAERGPVSLGRTQQRALLAILLLHANHSLPTDQLVELLWPEKPPGRPQTAIQGYVSALRKLLGRETIETCGGGYLLRTDPEQLDLHRFERLLHEGRVAVANENPRRAAQFLEDGLALWRGPALCDFTYEPWAQREIGRLEEFRLVARETLIDARLALGEHTELVGELEALIDEHRLRERPRGQLMLALYRCGRQAEALDVYQDTRERLRDDLGIDPSPELQALYKRILNQDDALTVEAPAPTRPTNLPSPPNVLIGRERELAQVAALLGREDVRLVTLTGVGGTGKTRLAHQAATNLLDRFHDGVFLVSLSTLTDPELVMPTIAQTLGLPERAGETVEGTLANHLREKQMLLLLDNFEQIVAAAPSVASLLGAAPDVKVLVTSRTPLHLSGERAYEVPPLALPDPHTLPEFDALLRYDAVSLFFERAGAAKAGFTATNENASAIAEICLRLDGLPLAIELAAARITTLSPQALLRRLDERLKLLTKGSRDLPARQQTLRATIDWSYGLLNNAEQRLFARLSVFAGGARLEAAEAVCDPAGELGLDALDGLAALVEKNLLRQKEDPDGEPRFWMLETIGEYARERLEASAAAREISRRYASHFIAVAEEADGSGWEGVERVWLERLEAEQANFRSVLTASREAGRAIEQLRLAAALGRFWVLKARLREGLGWLDEALSRGAKLPSGHRQNALHRAGALATEHGDYERAERYGETLLALGRRLDSPDVIGSADTILGISAKRRGDVATARRFFEEALHLSRQGDNLRWIAVDLENLGELALQEGDHDRAIQLFIESLGTMREHGSPTDIGAALVGLAYAALCQDRPQESLDSIVEALAIYAEVRSPRLAIKCLECAATALQALGRQDRSARVLGAAAALEAETGYELEPFEAGVRERTVAALRQGLGEKELEFEFEWAYGQSMAIDEAMTFTIEALRSLNPDREGVSARPVTAR